MMTASNTPSEIVALYPDMRHILERFDILPDNKITSIDLQAQTLGLNSDFLLELANASLEPLHASFRDFENYEIPVLVDYLKRSHDHYLLKRLPEIGQSIYALQHEFSAVSSIYMLLSGFFVAYRKELAAHFKYEEKYLFPYARLLASTGRVRDHLSDFPEINEGYSIQEFLDNHTNTEIELQAVRNALLQYTIAKDSGLPYQVLLKQLASFEKDMHLHSLIEDQVLIRKLMKLESEADKN